VGIRRSAESCSRPRLVEIAARDDDVKGPMSGYAVAHLDEIDEMNDLAPRATHALTDEQERR
jgi:hypothetical protein